jgi:3-deoxy-manno-octulosonate cytidylyltransferase (CMP-KDO synthetase)
MQLADRIVVATDAVEVVAACRDAGAEVVMTRASHASGTDRVAEVAAMPAYAQYDVIVNVQGDEPFVSALAVRDAASLVATRRFDLGTAACTIDPDKVDDVLTTPSIVKVVVDDSGRAMYFSRAPIPFLRDAADRREHLAVVRQHIGVYAYRRDALARWVSLPTHALEAVERLEQLRPLAAGIPMGVATVTAPARSGIDTENDLALANASWPDTSEDEH